MSSAAAYRVPPIVEWDDFIDAVRANGGRGFSYGAPSPTVATPRTCSVFGCDCGAKYVPSRATMTALAATTPIPMPTTTPAPTPATTTTPTPSVTPAVTTTA